MQNTGHIGISASYSSEMLPDLISTVEAAQPLELFIINVILLEGKNLPSKYCHSGNVTRNDSWNTTCLLTLAVDESE
jgi:hypothetical protein